VNNQALQFQAAGMNQEQALRAALANQGVDVTRAQADQQAALGVQQLGTQTGLQTALANLSNEQQARVNNQALQFQAAGMNQEQALRAALANQGVDVTRAQANQQAALGVQQLGAQIGLQAALANLDADTQARVQNLAAQLQTQGLNADQAFRAALANQHADLEAQRLSEQSRQFGMQQGLAGLELAGQMGQTLGNLGQFQQNANIQRLRAQAEAAAEQRALQQQYLDQAYADFLRQRDYPMEVLGQYSNLLRGLPMQLNSTQTTYAPPPSMASQILGTGLGALGLYRTLGG
jgi:hypothetical protein